MAATKKKSAPKSAPTSISVGFTLEKETTGALRYTEDGFDKSNMDATAIGTLYIRKAAFPDGDYPQSLTVTINV